MIPWEAINSSAMAALPSLLREWFPAGRERGHEFFIGDIDGNPGESFKVNVQTGKWSDFANPSLKGGDPISLYAAKFGVEQSAAAVELGGRLGVHLNGSAPKPLAPARPAVDWVPDLSPPGPAPVHKVRCDALYAYHGADGRLLFYVRRVNKGDAKDFYPLTFGRLDGVAGWHDKSPPRPRPLYGLDRLAKHPDREVLLCEGEKAADAAQALFPSRVAVTWAGGANAVATADWGPLQGRRVIVWPDNDEAGQKATAELLTRFPQARVLVVSDLPHGADAADVAPADPETWLAARLPAARLAVATAQDWRDAEYSNVVGLPVVTKKKKKATAPSFDQDWQSEWQTSETGTPLPNLFNAMVVMRKYPPLCDLIEYDEMQRGAVVTSAPPGMTTKHSYPRALSDRDVIAIQEEMQRNGLRRMAKTTVQDAIDARAGENSVHPVVEYLESLQWDGTQRAYGWLGRYLGVEGNAYSDTIGKLFLIALVARVMQPGCKADYMLILEGPQGAMKSSACRVLAGEWFSDNLPDLSRGDAVRLSMHLRGKWLIEIAEMSSFNAAETHTLKEFLTQTEERYTPKYARQEVCEPRQCLFIGSTNEGAYLRDATGARRFWPVKVGTIDLEGLRQDRDQILAEAVHLFRSGAHWWPEREFEAEHIAPEQEARFEEDVWETEIRSWLEAQIATRFTVVEIARGALVIETGKLGTREQRRIVSILTRLGWIQKRSKSGRWYERA